MSSVRKESPAACGAWGNLCAGPSGRRPTLPWAGLNAGGAAHTFACTHITLHILLLLPTCTLCCAVLLGGPEPPIPLCAACALGNLLILFYSSIQAWTPTWCWSAPATAWRAAASSWPRCAGMPFLLG